MKPPLPIVALLLACTAQAGMYRWVDDNGMTVYSQTPPPDRDAHTLKPLPPPAASPEQAQRQLDQQLQQKNDYMEDRELAAEQRRNEQDERKLIEENCRRARSNLENLEDATRRLLLMPDGSYQRLTEEDRQQRMQEARELLDQHCR